MWYARQHGGKYRTLTVVSGRQKELETVKKKYSIVISTNLLTCLPIIIESFIVSSRRLVVRSGPKGQMSQLEKGKENRPHTVAIFSDREMLPFPVFVYGVRIPPDSDRFLPHPSSDHQFWEHFPKGRLSSVRARTGTGSRTVLVASVLLTGRRQEVKNG
jgi:hypothetical protein